jgi:hypothetical protein
MKRHLSGLGALLVDACVLGTSVNATPVAFDFTVGTTGALTSSEAFSESGINLTVTSTNGDIHRNGTNGLGVTGGPDRNRMGTGGGVRESLTFTFSENVNLKSIVVMEHRGGNERFRILDGSNSVLSNFTPDFPSSGVI